MLLPSPNYAYWGIKEHRRLVHSERGKQAGNAYPSWSLSLWSLRIRRFFMEAEYGHVVLACWRHWKKAQNEQTTNWKLFRFCRLTYEQTTKWKSILSFWCLEEVIKTNKRRNKVSILRSVVCSYDTLCKREKKNEPTTKWTLISSCMVPCKSRQNEQKTKWNFFSAFRRLFVSARCKRCQND